MATIAIAVATLCAFWFANNAAAQQTSVDYSASPSGLVSVNADGQLVVLPQANAGLMTATIEATGYTLNAQNQYVRSGFAGERYITLNILGACTIGGGCGAFGLQGLDQTGRIAAFRAWDLATLSMFIASGANVNENIGTQASGLLLYYLANVNTDNPKTENISLLVAAGADVNARASGGFAMLHIAVSNVEESKDITGELLKIPGIDVNIRSNGGQTPLDRIVIFYDIYNSIEQEILAARAAVLRAAGGECRTRSHAVVCGE